MTAVPIQKKKKKKKKDMTLGDGQYQLEEVAEMKWKVIQAEAASSSWQRCGNIFFQRIAMAKCRRKHCHLKSACHAACALWRVVQRFSVSPHYKCRRGSFGEGKINEMIHLFIDVQYRKHLFSIDGAAESRTSDCGQLVGHVYSPRAARVRCAAHMPVMLSPSLPFK